MNKTVPAVCLLLLACSPAEPMPDLAETLRKNHATVRSEGVTVENTEKLLRIEESLGEMAEYAGWKPFKK